MKPFISSFLSASLTRCSESLSERANSAWPGYASQVEVLMVPSSQSFSSTLFSHGVNVSVPRNEEKNASHRRLQNCSASCLRSIGSPRSVDLRWVRPGVERLFGVFLFDSLLPP